MDWLRMKASFLPLAAALLVIGASAATSRPAGADLAAEGLKALDAWQVEEAASCAQELLRMDPASGPGHYLAARVAFAQGDYAACRQHLKTLQDQGAPRPQDIAAVVERLQPVHEAFQERASGQFRLRWSHPADAVLAEYAFPVLEKAWEATCAALRYEGTGATVLVEVYPDIESFAAASTLTLDEIESSGAVAICKFNRVMLASPRLYVQGYPWCDTLSHELVHYVVARKTGNRAPVWLHEGIAKHCEPLWRGSPQEAALSPLHSTLLAEALEGGRLIAFERMHPSFARLGSQEEAALAFAQVASFVEFLRERVGPDVLPALLEALAAGTEPEQAIQQVSGAAMDGLHEQWLLWLSGRKLERIPGLLPVPRRLSEGADNAEQTSDLSGVLPEAEFRFVRLGDMLIEEGRPAAAAVEYQKAAQQTAFVSPHVHVRLARAQMDSGASDRAEKTLDNTRRYYPDYLPLHIARGELFMRRGEPAPAVAAMEESVRINPFDPRPHAALAELYGQQGQMEERARELRVLEAIAGWLGG